MDTSLEERFEVFLRDRSKAGQAWEAKERKLVTCSSYEEAQWVRRECSSPTRSCIIRYFGPAGGGD
jgi:hypothetical protein